MGKLKQTIFQDFLKNAALGQFKKNPGFSSELFQNPDEACFFCLFFKPMFGLLVAQLIFT
jgi:hypothetical protein